jgi:cellulose synthase/poly-beta-1,6-N-acetylglucosamine synthase-like glycosyltransferase
VPNVFLFLISAAALLLLLPVAILFVEVLLAVAIRPAPRSAAGARPRIAILIPAHNEATLIGASVRCIASQLVMTDRLIVVADNCTDDTAAIARAAGAETIERTDLTRRGKGYALDFGVRHLSADAPEVLIIIDADCQVAAGAIDRLARACQHSARPVQALYLMASASGATAMQRIAEFAWTVKNRVRPLGLYHLGLPCQLMGTGMAFPWARIQGAALATGHIVEDLKLGIELAHNGAPPLFCPDALVTSQFPASGEGIDSQRARWEHGYLSVILSDAPRLLWAAIAKRKLDLLAMALDLSVPPLALLMLQTSLVWFASLIAYWLVDSWAPLAVSSTAVVLLALSVLLSRAAFGRRIISFAHLPLAAVYALRKIPLYGRFLVSRQVSWVRSKRDAE